MKRFWLIPHCLLVLVGMVLFFIEWAVDGLGMLAYRADMWVEKRMKESSNAR